MDWHNRLAERRKKFENVPNDQLPKLTKPSSVSFVSDLPNHLQNISGTAPEKMQTRLRAMAADARVRLAIVERLPADELTACADCTDTELRGYLRALKYGATMDSGQCPPDYVEPATCAGCGPVWLWPGAPDRVLACPWCFRRKAGKPVPRPPRG